MKPPAEARNVLYSHVSRIRQLLRQAAGLGHDTAARLQRRDAGYVLDIGSGLVDLHQFGYLHDRGRDPSRGDAERASALTEALGLWRGTPLAALPGEWMASVRESCHRRRLDTAVHWAHAELRLGHADSVIDALPGLITEYPLAEPLECLLMEAMHAAGRDAEAIDRYATVRERLAEALGADPGQPLQALYEAILRGELRPAPQPGEALAAPGARPRLAAAAGRIRVQRPRGAAAPAGRRRGHRVPGTGRARRGGGHRCDRRDGRGREDNAGGALGAPGGSAVRRRAALREPSRVRPEPLAGAAGRGGTRFS